MSHVTVSSSSTPPPPTPPPPATATKPRMIGNLLLSEPLIVKTARGYRATRRLMSSPPPRPHLSPPSEWSLSSTCSTKSRISSWSTTYCTESAMSSPSSSLPSQLQPALATSTPTRPPSASSCRVMLTRLSASTVMRHTARPSTSGPRRPATKHRRIMVDMTSSSDEENEDPAYIRAYAGSARSDGASIFSAEEDALIIRHALSTGTVASTRSWDALKATCAASSLSARVSPAQMRYRVEQLCRGQHTIEIGQRYEEELRKLRALHYYQVLLRK